MNDWFNPATLAIATILATGGAAVWVAMYRDVIWAASVPPTRQGPRRAPGRSRQVAAAPPKQAETPPKQAATVSLPVSPIATPDSDPEMIAIRVLAKLVKAGCIGQTVALENAFDVKSGNSKAYTRVQEKFKTAKIELDQTEVKAEQTATKS